MKNIFPIIPLALASMIPSQASAQDFEVSPVNFLFTATPGTMQTREVFITNHSNSAGIFKLRLEDYDIDEEGHRRTLARGASMYSCAPWISISPSTLGIDPHSQGVVKLTISVPSDGRDSRWAQIVVSQYNEQTSFQADNSAAGLFLSPEIVIDVEQTPLELREYKAQLSSFYEVETGLEDQHQFTVTVTNQGRTIISGNLYIVAANMNSLQEFEILKTKVRIYNGASQKLRLKLEPDMLPPGEYDFTCLFDMGPNLPLKGIKLKSPVIVK